MPKQPTVSLRQHLASLLRGKEAHLAMAEAIADFPVDLRGVKPAGAPHTAWQLLEHMRLTQEDILDFSRNPDYKERTFPDDYWPATEAPPNAADWDKSIAQFQSDSQAIQTLAADTKNDLLVELPHGTGQTLLREVLLVADHNSYHLGQFLFLRKMLESGLHLRG